MTPRILGSLSHDNVIAIREDRQEQLWVGTRHGLNLFDRSRGTFTAFTTKDGLPDDTIEAILEDGQGYLWLATHNGLSRFHPPTKTFRNYSEADGLPSNFLNPYGVEGSWQSQDGEMVFGSMNGVTTFYPDRLSPNPYVPPVVLTDFHLFNKPVLPGADSPLHKPIWATDSLTLTHTQSIFTLEFAGLSYAAPEKNRYRYRLEGLESEWNEVDSRRRQATYTSLPAGRYVFRVQASQQGWGVEREGRHPRPYGPAALVGDMVVQEPDGSGVCGLDFRRATKCGSRSWSGGKSSWMRWCNSAPRSSARTMTRSR